MKFRRAVTSRLTVSLAISLSMLVGAAACGGADDPGGGGSGGDGGDSGGSGGKAGSGGRSGNGGGGSAAGNNGAGSGGSGGSGGSSGSGGDAGASGGAAGAGTAGAGGAPTGGPYLSKSVDNSGWGAPTMIPVPAGLMIRPNGGTKLLTAPKLAKPLPAGSTISRTMTLIRTSTADKKNKVKILFYGQSITRQPWFQTVIDYLKQTYPNVDFQFAMLASGGHGANEMRRASEHDVMPMYPDLIIYQNYGDYIDIDGIISDWRSRTTAEVVLQNWHLSTYDSDDLYLSHERMSYIYMPDTCTRQGCELQDVRSRFKAAYMAESKDLKSGAYTPDGIHLNEQGISLMANVSIDMFKNAPMNAPVDPLGMVSDWSVGNDVKWNGGTLDADFEGNRIDAIATGPIAINAADVLIDGKKPSEFPEAYAFTRPNGTDNLIDAAAPGWPWNVGAPFRIDHTSKLVIEDWTLTVNGTSHPFNFTVKGSVTGDDGMGSSGAMFKSPSGRVVIAPADWLMGLKSTQMGQMMIPKTVKWRAIGMFTDKYPGAAASAGSSTTLIQGISNGRHHIQIKTTDGKPLPIGTLRVYRPGLKL